MHGPCEPTSPAGKRQALGALSPASGDTSTRTQATLTGIGVVNALSPGADFVVQGSVYKVPAKFLIDTGAAVTVISSQFWERSRPEGAELTDPPRRRLVSVQGDPLQLQGTAKITMSLGGIVFHAEAVVADSLTTDVIVGRDFLQAEQCTIKMEKGSNTLYFNKQGISLRLGIDQSDPVVEHVSVILNQELHIPPCSEIETMGAVPTMTPPGYWMVEPDKQCRSATLVARAVVTPECVQFQFA